MQKPICIVTYTNSDKDGKYCVVWYKYKVPRIGIYYNGHSQKEWKQYWKFLLEKDDSLTYIVKKECSNYEENLRQAIECPPYISYIAKEGFDTMKKIPDEEGKISKLTIDMMGALDDTTI